MNHILIFDDPLKEYWAFTTEIKELLNYSELLYCNDVNYALYNAYKNQIKKHNITPELVKVFMNKHKHLIKKINKEYLNLGYEIRNQPMSCVIYYLITIEPETTKTLWIFTEAESAPLFNDLGYSFTE